MGQEALASPFEFEETIAVTSAVVEIDVISANDAPDLPGFFTVEAVVTALHFQSPGMWRLGEYRTDNLLSVSESETYTFSVLSLWDLQAGDDALVGLHNVQLADNDTALIKLVSRVDNAPGPTTVDGAYEERVHQFFELAEQRLDSSPSDTFVELVQSGRQWIGAINQGSSDAQPFGLLAQTSRDIAARDAEPFEVAERSQTDPAGSSALVGEATATLPTEVIVQLGPGLADLTFVAFDFPAGRAALPVGVNETGRYALQTVAAPVNGEFELLGWTRDQQPWTDAPVIVMAGTFGRNDETRAILVTASDQGAQSRSLNEAEYLATLGLLATPASPDGRSEEDN